MMLLGLVVRVVRVQSLVGEHRLQAGEGLVALRALGLEAHPELETFYVAHVLAERELL